VDRLALLLVQVFRDLDLQPVADVALALAFGLRRALAAQAGDRPVFGPRRDFDLFRAMQDRHLDRAAVDRLGDRDRHGYLEVAVVEPAEDRGRGHFRGHVEIAVGTAARARLAFAGEPDAGAVFDPGGDVDFVALALLGRAGALAGGAGGLDDLAAAAALGARLGDREEALVLRVDAAAFAARAGDRRGAGRGAGGVAGLAGRLPQGGGDDLRA